MIFFFCLTLTLLSLGCIICLSLFLSVGFSPVCFIFLHVVALLLHDSPVSCCCLLEALAVCGEAVVRVDGDDDDDGGIMWLFP